MIKRKQKDWYDPPPAGAPVRYPRRVPKRVVPSYIDHPDVELNYLMCEGGGGVVKDYTDRNNDGEINGAEWTDERSASWGLEFIDDEQDYVEIGDVLIDGWSELTVLAWVYPYSLGTSTDPDGHSMSDEHPIVHKVGESDDSLGITLCEDGTYFYLDDGANHTITGSAVPAEAWTHVGSVLDDSMHIYLNGDLDTEGETVGTLIDNTNSLRVGGRHEFDPSAAYYFDGIIPIVMICNKSLAGAEIKAHFEDTKPLVG